MSRRFAVLMISLLLAGISSVEIFYQAQEKELEDKTRKINGIPEGESWWFSGTGSPEERIAYRSMDSDSAGLFLRDPELGFRLRPNIRNVRSVSRRGGFTIFDARQSIGRFGWRIGKEAPNAKYDVLFLGDSFTYGAGLGDENTLPSLFTSYSEGLARAHNLGVPNWGLQQVLRTLELEMEKPELMGGTVAKVFLGITLEQIFRLSGMRPESAGSPKYELKSGNLERVGIFPEPNPWNLLCDLSAICSLWGSRGKDFSSDPEIVNRAVPLVVEILKKINLILKERYRSGTTVIVWNFNHPGLAFLEKSIREAGIDTVNAGEVLLRTGKKSDDFFFPWDRHPNRDANDVLAVYLVERLKR